MVKSSSSSVTNIKTCLRKGKWSPEEDQKLMAYINKYGIWNWVETPKASGLLRSGKSCRLRWMNYLRPGIKHGNFSQEENATIIKLQQLLGNRWSTIASRLPGRTDNEIKNHWHTNLRKYCLKKNLLHAEIDHTKTGTDDEKNPSEDNDVLLSNAQKASNFNYGSDFNASCSPFMPLQPSFNYCCPSSSCDPSCEIYNNQTIKDDNGSLKTYVELQSLWDPAPTYPVEGIYMVGDYGSTIDPGFLFSNTSTLASYYDAGDDLSAYLLMQTNEKSV